MITLGVTSSRSSAATMTTTTTGDYAFVAIINEVKIVMNEFSHQLRCYKYMAVARSSAPHASCESFVVYRPSAELKKAKIPFTMD